MAVDTLGEPLVGRRVCGGFAPCRSFRRSGAAWRRARRALALLRADRSRLRPDLLGEEGDDLASIASVLASLPSARAKSLIWRGLTTASGKPAPAIAAATVVSKPPVASSTISDTSSALRRSTRFSRPLPSRATAKASSDGRKCTSRRSLDTSIPTQHARRGSSMTHPCECGLDWPLRLFGRSDNRTQAAPCSLAGSSALRKIGLACVLNLAGFAPAGN